MKRISRVLASCGAAGILTGTALIVGTGGSSAGAQTAPAAAPAAVTVVGTTNARSLWQHAPKTPPNAGNESVLLGPEGDVPRTGGAAPPGDVAVTDVPLAKPGPSPVGSGFSGVTGAEQAAANSAYDLEPPDQGLCSDGTDVVEAVNNAYAVYSTTGAQVLGPIAFSAFFGIPPEQLDGAGSFTSDPRCYYDAATARWFVVELSIPNFFAPHTHASKSDELVAVSDTSDPTGGFTTFAIDSTDQSDHGCPCYGDFPTIGADASGFYIATNEFSIYKPILNGAQLYAVSKQGLEAAAVGGPLPTVLHFGGLASPFPAESVGETYHLSPALTPPDAPFASAAGGTEYLTMSDAFPVSSDLLAVYALTGTSTLGSAAPSLHLASTTVALGQYYQFPATGMAVSQEAATSPSQTPLLDFVESQTGSTVPEGVLQADFDSVQETTYANGKLYTELTTSASPTATVGTTTAEWFVLAPSVSGDSVSATVADEGNLGVSGQSLLYPDLVVNGSGAGDMVFTLVGANDFPSAAFVGFSGTAPTGKVHVAAAGSGPEDGNTCYVFFNVLNASGCRWGDFSGGVAVGSTIWMATEYVPPASTRDALTNWGTFIFDAPPGG